jgi:hypothetical protein
MEAGRVPRPRNEAEGALDVLEPSNASSAGSKHLFGRCKAAAQNGALPAYRLTFGPDPATHNLNTLGGMIGNNSCGVLSVKSGKTIENVEELEVLTYDGLRVRVRPTSDQEYVGIQRSGARAESNGPWTESG